MIAATTIAADTIARSENNGMVADENFKWVHSPLYVNVSFSQKGSKAYLFSPKLKRISFNCLLQR